MYLDKTRMKLLGLLEKESVVDESLKEKQSCNICLKYGWTWITFVSYLN